MIFLTITFRINFFLSSTDFEYYLTQAQMICTCNASVLHSNFDDSIYMTSYRFLWLNNNKNKHSQTHYSGGINAQDYVINEMT